MIEPLRRRFTIADGMILIAAASVAILITREYFTSTFVVYKRVSYHRLITLVEGVSTCLTAPIMLALIPIRLKRPRPGLGRLSRQPGFAACCAVAAVLASGFVEASIYAHFLPIEAWGGSWPFRQLWGVGVEFYGPFAVAGVWALLALTRRWKAEPSWVDRLGRGLGCVWVAWRVIPLIDTWLQMYLPAL